MILHNGDVLFGWPLQSHVITAGWFYNDGSLHRALDFRAAVGTRNPVGFDREAWALANQIDGMATLGKERIPVPKTPPLFNINRLREHIIRTWQTNAAQYPQGTGLMTALAVGNRSGLSPEMWAALRPLGLNHLISISGLHIGMVAVLAGWLCRFLLRFSPVMPARPRVWIGLVSWLAACVYTGLAGWEIPALRSLMMLTVLGAAWMVRGYVGGWQMWWAACTAVLLYQPASVLAAGFWLSFGLVGVLLWALACRLPAISKILPLRPRFCVMSAMCSVSWLMPPRLPTMVRR